MKGPPTRANDSMTKHFNTLVISDLHFGEDLSPSATEVQTRHIDLVEEQLCAFLRHYSRRREGGRPWRLVINGDLCDFLAISVFPGDPGLGDSASATAIERIYGVGRTPGAARQKMRAIVDRHPALFRALARFLARDNRVDIVCGNHDAELFWPEVQAVFRDAVAAACVAANDARQTAAAGARPPTAPPVGEVLSRLEFHQWFVHEPGAYWIEHGHQYDENCSFEYGLNPVAPGSEEIATNVDAAASRFVTNRVREADPHAQEDWSFGGYLSFGMSLGARGIWRLGRAYAQFSWALIKMWRLCASRSATTTERRALHFSRLEALAAKEGIPAATLRALDHLHRRPVTRNLSRLLKVLMLDKLLLYSAAILVALVAMMALPLLWGVTAVVATALVAAGGSWILSRGRHIDPSLALELSPSRIRKHLGVDLVIFGHTHRPVARALDGGGHYFNSGTWVPSGRPGILRAFTHIIIRQSDHGTAATLCQWRDGASRALTADWRPRAQKVAAEPVTAPGEAAPVAA